MPLDANFARLLGGYNSQIADQYRFVQNYNQFGQSSLAPIPNNNNFGFPGAGQLSASQAAYYQNQQALMFQQTQAMNALAGILGQFISGGANYQNYGIPPSSMGGLYGLLGGGGFGGNPILGLLLDSLSNLDLEGTDNDDDDDDDDSIATSANSTKAGKFLINDTFDIEDLDDEGELDDKAADLLNKISDDEDSNFSAAKFSKAAGDILASGVSSANRNKILTMLLRDDVSEALDVGAILTRPDVASTLSNAQSKKVSTVLAAKGLVFGDDNTVNTAQTGALVSGSGSTNAKVQKLAHQTTAKLYKKFFVDAIPTGMTTAQVTTYNANRDNLARVLSLQGFTFNNNQASNGPYNLADFYGDDD